MELAEILVLAVVQGVTEFLPISSSGHLVIVAALLGAESDVMEVNIVLHAGTLLSIVIYFWNRIWQLLGEDRRMLGLLVAATLPAAGIGLTVFKRWPHLLEDPLLAGFMLMVTGSMLLIASRWPVGEVSYQRLSWRSALGIGLAQSVALLPGISRSGSTICAGLAAGLSRRSAATFSFLMAIPAIGGGTLLELWELRGGSMTIATPWWHLVTGAIASFFVGLFSLWWLLRWLERGKLEYFGYWCLPAGLAVVVWQLAS